jgi:hypothetical protein
MACPLFEPQHVASSPKYPKSRLPLIDEYDGLCRAGTTAQPVPADSRFECCNHGYSQHRCDLFSAGEDQPHCLRYSVVERGPSTLSVMVVEEREYAPLAWHKVDYSIPRDEMVSQIDDVCVRAQALAFCRSLLKRFP